MPDDRDRRGGTAGLLRGDQPAQEEYREERDPNRSDGAIEARPHRDGSSGQGQDSQPLLTGEQLEKFRQRWEQSQRDFVDEPRRSVETADQLVADVVRQLAEGFATERSMLERQWDRGEDVSTDELRTAFQRYRSFFNRLLEV